MTDKDWRHELIEYLEQLSAKVGITLKRQALKYTLVTDGLLLKCVGTNENGWKYDMLDFCPFHNS